MRWIEKMKDTSFDGLDKLYHHAKFGEDRITRAGCRCENVVFLTMILPARRSKRCPCYGNVSGWLARWVGGYPSHAGIVSKRLNLSENLFHHVKAPSF